MTMVEIGQMLREAREKRALTIDQAQKQTRIHSSVLTALEEGNCDDILNATYVKSFLRKYSGYLGLDQDAILKRYTALHSRPAVHGSAANKPSERDSVETRLPTKFIFAALALVLIIALLFLGTLLWKMATKPTARPKRANAARAARPAIPAKAKKDVPKTNSPSRAAPSKNTPLRGGSASLRTPLRGGSASLRTPLRGGSASLRTPFNLAIRVKEPVLIQLKKDGVLLFKRVLSKGDVESYRVYNTANIYVAKAEAIEIILDGRILNVPVRGIVKNLEVTRDGVEIK